jgi:hypothetical protein
MTVFYIESVTYQSPRLIFRIRHPKSSPTLHQVSTTSKRTDHGNHHPIISRRCCDRDTSSALPPSFTVAALSYTSSASTGLDQVMLANPRSWYGRRRRLRVGSQGFGGIVAYYRFVVKLLSESGWSARPSDRSVIANIDACKKRKQQA